MGTQISAVTLGVKDLARAKRFYEAIGGRVEKDFPSFVSIAFDEGTTKLGLYPRDGLATMIGIPGEGSGFSGVVLDYNPPKKGKERVNEALAQVAAAGGTVVRAAQDQQWGGRTGYFSDPDGNIWQVASY